jgi:hypothetical protein
MIVKSAFRIWLAHDCEERVQDLVHHLRPPLPHLLLGDGAVHYARHLHEHDQQPRRDEPEPHEHRQVRGLPAPAHRVAPQLAPLDLPHERHAEPPPRLPALAATVSIVGVRPQRRGLILAAAADER